MENTNIQNSEKTEIIGVRFRDAGKTYYFAPGEVKANTGDCVIVETARGVEYGFVAVGNSFVDNSGYDCSDNGHHGGNSQHHQHGSN